jgi:hypothetical protein
MRAIGCKLNASKTTTSPRSPLGLPIAALVAEFAPRIEELLSLLVKSFFGIVTVVVFKEGGDDGNAR